MTVLVTRPAADARRTVERLAALGIEGLATPVLDIVPAAAFAIPDGPAAIVLTSANAVIALSGRGELARLVAIPAFCVGDHTAAVARRAGFRDVRSAGGDADDLLRLVRRTLEPADGPIVYLSGRVVSADLQGGLRDAGYRAQRVVVYDAKPAGELAGEARRRLLTGTVQAVLFHSARSATAFGQLADRCGLTPRLRAVPAIVLSDRVAAAARSAGFATIRVAGAPNEVALLSTLEDLINGGRRE